MDFEKAPYEGHPGQCQGVNNQGQCKNLGFKLDDGGYANFCMAHGGRHARNKQKKDSIRNYRLSVLKWQAELDQKTDSKAIKSLREEIGILRVVLEQRLNRCEDAADLILQSGPISDMVMKINTVVTSCHKLEGAMGHLLDKQAILQFATVVIGIITKVVTDEAQVNTIAEEILTTVGQIGRME